MFQPDTDILYVRKPTPVLHLGVIDQLILIPFPSNSVIPEIPSKVQWTSPTGRQGLWDFIIYSATDRRITRHYLKRLLTFADLDEFGTWKLLSPNIPGRHIFEVIRTETAVDVPAQIQNPVDPQPFSNSGPPVFQPYFLPGDLNPQSNGGQNPEIIIAVIEPPMTLPQPPG